jgi:hypothetical protein
MQVTMYWIPARKQVIDNRGQRKPKPNAIRNDMLPDGRRRYERR